LNPRNVSSLYGRGLARLKRHDAVGGEADIQGAKALKPDVAEELARYGIR
jgi:hypothetical protein